MKGPPESRRTVRVRNGESAAFGQTSPVILGAPCGGRRCTPYHGHCWSRLCGNVDDTGGGTPDFCCVFVGGNLKLCDSLFREVHQRSAHHFVVVVGAIDDDVAASSVRPCRRNLHRVCFGGIKARRRAVPRNQKRQIQKVPAIQRRVSIAPDSITPWTSDCVRFTAISPAVTSTTCPAPVILRETSSVRARPTSR